MQRSSTENSIQDGDSNTQIGHNTGTITVGYTVQEHEAALEKALTTKAADLERAHGAERQLLRNELDAIKAKLDDLAEDHKARLKELKDAKRLLARHDNKLDSEKRDAAYRALDAGETTLAQALLKELAKQASARREDAAKEEAEFEFELGKLAEQEVRWHDAYTHYKRVLELHDETVHLRAYARMAWRLAKGDEVIAAQTRLVEQVKSKKGKQGPGYSTEINNLAVMMEALGQYAEAERLLRQSLEIACVAVGEGHPAYAARLNNLASVLRDQGRTAKAEAVYRQALEITRATLGEDHPDYANRLNNLGDVLRDQGKYAEAEDLFRQALEIDRTTIGEAHPDYATHLNNFALAVQAQRRSEEAEALCRQALEIDRAAIGKAHPSYANHLSNLARTVQAQGRYAEAEALYRQALEIDRATIGEGHPDYAIHLGNLGRLLGDQGKVDEALAMLEQALATFQAALPPDHTHIAETQRRIDALPVAKD